MLGSGKNETAHASKENFTLTRRWVRRDDLFYEVGSTAAYFSYFPRITDYRFLSELDNRATGLNCRDYHGNFIINNGH